MSIDIEVVASTRNAEAKIAALRAKILELSNKKVDIDYNASKATEQIRLLGTKADNAFRARAVEVKVSPKTKSEMVALEKDAAQVDSRLDRLRRPINPDMSLFRSGLSGTGVVLGKLGDTLRGIGQIRIGGPSNRQASEGIKAQTKDVHALNGALKETNFLSQNMGNIFASMAGLGATYGIIRLSDAVTNLDSKLRASTDSARSFNQAFSQTADIALNTRAPLADITSLYTKMLISAKNFGGTQAEVARITETVSKALTIGGATTQESASVILQLGQAIGSGVLQGQELNAILESSIPLSSALAAGLKVSVGELKAMAAAGEITSKDVFNALLSQSQQIDAQYGKVGITFSGAFQNMSNAVLLLSTAFTKTFFSGKGGPAEQINNLAIGFASLAKNLDFIVYKMEFRLLMLAGSIENTFKSVVGSVGKSFESLYDILSGGLQLPKIRLSDFMPDLQSAAKTVMTVVTSIERAFFWLYDRVIGHSWVPDLVDGILFWFEKLTTAPVKIVTNLTKTIDMLFSSVAKIIPKLKETEIVKTSGNTAFTLNLPDTFDKFLKQLKAIMNPSRSPEIMKNEISLGISALASALLTQLPRVLGGVMNPATLQLIAIVGIATSIYVAITSLLGMFDTQNIRLTKTLSALDSLKFSFATSLDGLKNNFKENAIVKAITKGFQESDSAFIHTFKQIFGIQDKVKYRFSNPNEQSGTQWSDPTAPVGRGKNRANSTTVQNIVNALPVGAQIPVLTGVAAAAALAVGMVFKGHPFMGLLLGAVGVTFVQTVANAVDGNEIKRSFKALAEFFLKQIQSGMDLVFQGHLRNPFGLLAIMAKLSLIIAEGKKGAAETLLTIAKFPTTIGRGIAMNIEARTFDSRIKANDRLRGMRGETVNAAIGAAQANVNRATVLNDPARLALAQTQLTRAMLDQRAMIVKDHYDRAKEGTPAKAAALVNLEAMKQQLAAAGMAKRNMIQFSEQLAENRSRLTNLNDTLKATIAARKEASKESMVNAASMLGGGAGAYMGFKYGEQIAAKLDGWSGWGRAGVTMGIAMTGQLIGAGIGSSIAQTIMWTLPKASSLIMTALKSPMFYLVAALAAVLAVILDPERFRPILDDAWLSLKFVMEDAWRTLGFILKEASTALITGIRDLFPKSSLPGTPDTPEERATAVVGTAGIAAGVAAAATLVPKIPTFAAAGAINTARTAVASAGAAESALVSAQQVLASQQANLAALRDAAVRGVDILTRINAQQLIPAATNAVAAAESSVGLAQQVATTARQTATATSQVAASVATWRGMFANLMSGPSLFAPIMNALRSIGPNISLYIAGLTGTIAAIAVAVPALPAIGTAVLIALGTAAVMWAISAAYDYFLGPAKDVKVSPKVAVPPTPASSAPKPRTAAEMAASVAQIPRRNAGGLVSGPGGPKDDNLITFLSNKEFVVNAKDAQKNLGLLSRINSGEKFQMLASGSPSVFGLGENNGYATQMSTKEERAISREIAAQVADKLKVDKVFVDKLFMKESGYHAAAVSRTGAVGVGQLMPRTANALGMNIPPEVIMWQDKMEKYARDNKVSKAVAADKIGKMPIVEGDKRFDRDENISRAVAMVAKLATKMGGGLDKVTFAYNAGESALLENLRGNDANKELKTAAELFKSGVIDMTKNIPRETRVHIAKTVPGANETWADSIKKRPIQGSFMEQVSDAMETIGGYIAPWMARLEKVFGFKDDPTKLSSRLKVAPSKDAANAMVLADPVIKSLGITAEQLAKVDLDTLEQMGTLADSVAEFGDAALMASKGIKGARAEFEKAKALSAIARMAAGEKNVTPEDKPRDTPLQKANRVTTALANRSVSDIVPTLNEAIKGKGLGTFPAELSKSNDGLERAVTLVENLAEAEEANAKEPNAKIELAMAKTRVLILELIKSINEDLAAAKETGPGGKALSGPAKLAGGTFATNFESDFAAGVSSMLSGRVKASGVVKGLAARFTSSVLETFSKSFSEDLFKATGFDKLLKQGMGGMASIGEDAGKGIGKGIREFFFGKPEAANVGIGKPEQSQDSIFKGIFPGEANSFDAANGDGVTTAMKNANAPVVEGLVTLNDTSKEGFAALLIRMVASALTSAGAGISTGVSAIGALFKGASAATGSGAPIAWDLGFADGGFVSGPGTGTSDSILALLSNGESVINAKSTKRFRPLIASINSGKLSRFATGGMVGDLPNLSASDSLINSSSNSSTAKSTTVNIAITGDISRQTKREVMAMLPQISNGVNGYNRENNYKPPSR